MHDKVIAEESAKEERVLEEGRERRTFDPSTPLHQVLGQLRDAMQCPDCGKTRAVMNINIGTKRRGVVAERVSPETHCACPGGPAYAGIGSTIAREG